MVSKDNLYLFINILLILFMLIFIITISYPSQLPLLIYIGILLLFNQNIYYSRVRK